MGDFLGRTKFSMLRTNYYYYYFNNDIGVCEGDSFNDKAKEILDKHPELKGVSEKILKALCYVHRKSMRTDFKNDICDFLFYWIGDIILKDLKNKEFFGEIMLNLFETLNKSGTREICNFSYNNIYEENFKNVKLIFDYSEDYNSYEEQIIGYNPPCNQDYKEYLKTYVDTYNKFNNKCTVEKSNENYCEAFKKYFDGKDANLLSTWTCDLRKNDPRDKEFEEEEGEGEEDAERAAQMEQVSPGPVTDTHDPMLLQRSPSASEAQAMVPGIPGPHLDRGSFLIDSASSPKDDKSTSITSKSITGALSVAGILVPSYLVYNYTPAGIWISKLLGRNKGPNFNSYANQELMPNFSMPGDSYSERSRYNISYRPE
ncbi:unnamed protein product [Plasmodium vivax]|uniref:(malaria parasite P. vivax) hypothetical protein n=1 Tax=Plasmodium vivax TaxID=5855 RepID=A0A8S4HBY9_PLAVI|nr:unnamed protein product [Plasmodium vivax]